MFRSGGGLGAYYYTADVAGLNWGKVPGGSNIASYIADETLPRADDAPVAHRTSFDWDNDGTVDWMIAGKPPALPIPKSSYLFGAIKNDSSGRPYKAVGGGANTSAYGFYVRPEIYGKSGRRTYIVNETGTVYCNDMGTSSPVTAYSNTSWQPCGEDCGCPEPPGLFFERNVIIGIIGTFVAASLVILIMHLYRKT